MRRGAVVSILLSLIKYMPNRHIRFWVVSLVDFDVESQKAFQAMGVQTLQLQCDSRGWVKGLVELYRVLQDQSFQVIHCHLSKANIIGTLISRWLNIPYRYVTLHNVWSGHRTYFQRLFPLIKHWSTKRFYVSQTVYASFPIKHFSENDLVIYNPIDCQGILSQLNETHCLLIQKEFNLHNQFVLVSVGRLVPQKNHHLLLRVFKRFLRYVPNSKLLIVGQGVLKNIIQDQIEEYSLQHQVLCTGFRRDVIAIIKVADVVINPSYWEGFSITMLESMVLGKPFIGSKILPFEEAIISGENGFLVEGDNPDAYAKILHRLYRDPSLRERVAAAAKSTVKKYDAEYIAKQYVRFYSLSPCEVS